MDIEDIRSLKHKKPFEPFNIVMNDGDIIWVASPERIALSPTGKTVAVYEGNACSLFAVHRMRELQPQAAPPLRKKRKGE